MTNSILKDVNGREIKVGDQVLLDGDVYDVMINPFNSKIVVDNDCGQESLESVHTKCQVIKGELDSLTREIIHSIKMNSPRIVEDLNKEGKL